MRRIMMGQKSYSEHFRAGYVAGYQSPAFDVAKIERCKPTPYLYGFRAGQKSAITPLDKHLRD